MIDVRSTVDWLVKGASGSPTPMALVARMAPELVTAGIPVDRIVAFVRTLHPHILGRSFRWVPGQEVAVGELSYSYLTSPLFLLSPLAKVIESGEVYRERLMEGDAPRSGVGQDLKNDGFTDYIVLPMRFLSGQVHPITFATRHAGGFTAQHIDALGEVVPPLSRIGEIFALQRTAATLLSTYVGRNAGDRIMAGQIQRGDSDKMRAVIWFSDLRGFTALSDRVSPAELIGVLNELFECQVPAIEKHGGEVLKFIGDGLLAIFPIEGDQKSAAAQTEAALSAGDEAFAALEARNASARVRGGYEMRFGMALHLGDIVYGNIGGAGRLDFTCIGTAVNVAARLEAVASKVGRARVVSAEIANLTKRPHEALGEFELKGVTAPQQVFGV